MPETYQNISVNIDERVAFITLRRPPLNVLNIAMMREIGAALNDFDNQNELVAIVFQAAKDCRAFSAGVAVEDHVPETIYQMLDSFHNIFLSLEQIARPVIAVVDGAALGGGCELVAASDIVIASDKARFGQPEIKLGVFPPVSSVFLPLAIGEKRARELVLTGELIDATASLRWGLVNYVVPSNQLEHKTLEIVARLRDLSGMALSYARKSLDMGRGRSLNETLGALEDMYLNELMKTSDALEGIKAFMEKRKPVWRNR